MARAATCLFLCALTALSVCAQPALSPSAGWRKALIRRYEQQQRALARLARQYQWASHKNYSSQRTIRLQGFDDFGQPSYYQLHNTEAALSTRTSALQAGGNLSLTLSGGSSVMAGRLGLWDGGRVLAGHRELGNARIQQKDGNATSSDHATHLSGTLIAQGINADAKGMAPGASLSVWDYTNDIAELATAAEKLLVSNHAYGPVSGWVYDPSRPGTDPNLKWEWWGTPALSQTEDYQFGFYTAKARDIDQIAYNNPFLLMVRSADNKRGETGPPANTPYYLRNTDQTSTLPRNRNDGYDVIPAEATAKNVLTVGAADVRFDKQQPVLNSTTTFSGWGPTDDGRIKPDLLGMGTNVFSTLASGESAYGYYTGTSMASANVSGSLFLLQELYNQQQTGGGQNGRTTGSGSFMRSATLRGLVLHTASRPNPANGPDYRQGWGLLNTEAAARVILNTDLAHLISEQSLRPNSTVSQQVVAQGNEPLVITLCWTDPEGTATPAVPASVNNRTPKLVNDLDIRVSDGTTTFQPFVLNPDNPANPATRGDNIRDNVEQVYIANPAPGQAYTVHVSHKGNLTYGNQPFTVIVSGLRRVVCRLDARIESSRDTVICAGTSLPLKSAWAEAGMTYQWLRDDAPMPDADGATLSVTESGAYALRISDGNGCRATSAPVRVRVSTPTLTLSPAGEQWLCNDKTPIPFKAAAAPNARIDWLRNGAVIAESIATIDVNQPGRYQARVRQDGCERTSAETVVRSLASDVELLPAEPEIRLPAQATVTLQAPENSQFSYRWYRNDSLLTNATSNRLHVGRPGRYKVQVSRQSCVGWSSERLVRLDASAAGVDSTNRLFVFFPNPVERLLTVRVMDTPAKQVLVSILDERGQLMRRQSLPATAVFGRFEGDLPVADLPPGSYIIQLSGDFATQTGRFLKK